MGCYIEVENEVCIEDDDDEDFENIQLVLTISKNDEEDKLVNFMNNHDFS